MKKIDDAFLRSRPLSPSSLKAFRKSPKHYMEYLFGEKKEIPAFVMGNIIDCLLTEPEMFDKRILEYEKPNLRTNVGKATMQELKDRATEKRMTLATKEEIDRARLAVEGCLSVDLARELIESRTKGQVNLEWFDKKNNLPIRGRTDMESNAWGEKWIVEVKTTGKTQGADPEKFMRDALTLGYDIQAAAYLDGYHKTRFSFPNFVFIVIETEEPFNCSVNFCDNKFIEEAKAEWAGTLAAFRYCMDNKLFHQGYEFRLHTMPYFSLRYPGWNKSLFANFNSGTDESN